MFVAASQPRTTPSNANQFSVHSASLPLGMYVSRVLSLSLMIRGSSTGGGSGTSCERVRMAGVQDDGSSRTAGSNPPGAPLP
jgi:hypothetical protein